MLKILSLFDGELGRDPRPTKIVVQLMKLGHITVCATPPQCMEDFVGFEMEHLHGWRDAKRSFFQKVMRRVYLLAGCFSKEIWSEELLRLRAKYSSVSFDIILCHSIELLPLACIIASTCKAKIVMDLREYYPRQMEDNLEWRLLWKKYYTFICHEYLPQVDIAFTVSPGLAKEYKREFGVDCILLPSYAPYCDIEPHVTPHPIRCIHHGGANKGRKLEVMIEAMRLLGGTYTLDLMLMPNDVPYINFLKGKAKDIPWVRFCEPVSMLDIVKSIAEYDVGLYPLTPVNFNHLHAWPNKLFEFIQARLAVVVSPVPDMAALVREYGVGVVTDGYSAEEVARTLRDLTPDVIDAYKECSHRAAAKLCWEKNEEVVKKYIF